MKFQGHIEELGDKVITSTKGDIFCTEIITVTCPKCFKPTDQVVTAKDRTYYGHFLRNTLTTQWCIIERHRDFLPDEFLYAQIVQGNQENLNISSVPSIW